MKARHYLYVIYLIIVTLIVTGVSFSRYSTTITTSSTAVVAAPVLNYKVVSAKLNGDDLTLNSESINLENVLPGDELVYQFEINNFDDSEPGKINQVLLRYKLLVEFDPSEKQLPLSYDLESDQQSSLSPDEWIYLGFGTQETHGYTLTVTWDEDESGDIYEDQSQTVKIEVLAEQARSTD